MPESKKLFNDKIKDGVLILVEPHSIKKCKCTLWFDFTMEAMRSISEGDLVAIQNFNTTSTSNRYSIFRLTEVHPSHFALTKADLSAYPGNIEESARNIFPDFTEQEKESTEDLTKIKCEAFPINLQYDDEGELNPKNLSEDDSLPITGSDVSLVSNELMDLIFNYAIDRKNPTTVQIGTLIKKPEVEILANSEELLKVHFGLFGYTGAGKSNFVSTLIRSILIQSKTSNKFVLFDIMDEYTGLLIDQLLNPDVNGMLISLGQRYLPSSVIQYLRNRQNTEISQETLQSQLEQAANDLLQGLLLPKALRQPKLRNNYLPLIRRLLDEQRIRVIDLTYTRTVEEFSTEIFGIIFDDYVTGATQAELEQMWNDIFKGSHANEEITSELAQTLSDDFESRKKPVGTPRAPTVNDRIDGIKNLLKARIIDVSQNPLPTEVTYTVNQIISDLSSNSKKSLFILTSDDPDNLRRHAKQIGQFIYDHRTRNAIISPIVSFIFDEADEFIPASPTGTQKESVKIVEKLARRGRKFGLGIGIATQRASYLNTSIMGQPHTYFMSKLPREYDRKVIGESFGLAEEDLRETLKYKKGDWMFISHDAAGLESEPIPIHAPNTEDVIITLLEQNSPGSIIPEQETQDS